MNWFVTSKNDMWPAQNCIKMVWVVQNRIMFLSNCFYYVKRCHLFCTNQAETKGISFGLTFIIIPLLHRDTVAKLMCKYLWVGRSWALSRLYPTKLSSIALGKLGECHSHSSAGRETCSLANSAYMSGWWEASANQSSLDGRCICGGAFQNPGTTLSVVRGSIPKLFELPSATVTRQTWRAKPVEKVRSRQTCRPLNTPDLVVVAWKDWAAC